MAVTLPENSSETINLWRGVRGPLYQSKINVERGRGGGERGPKLQVH